jgi:hypothetical protein
MMEVALIGIQMTTMTLLFLMTALSKPEQFQERRTLRLTNAVIPETTAYLPTTNFRKRSFPCLLITACMQALAHASRDGLELHGLSQVRGAQVEAEVAAVVAAVEDWEEGTKVLSEALDKPSSRATNLWLCSGKQSMPWLMSKILRKHLASSRRP